MAIKNKLRCINIDWLEVYCLESNDRYPCNAEYFRRNGYEVKEREYGTRVYNEMFELLDKEGNPIIEIRRNPASGDSSFKGLCEQSTHIRLPNWLLYQNNPIDFLRRFLAENNYIFKRIFRIDIAYDFERFDSGDDPAKFLRRYIEGKYRKLNQTKIAMWGDDGWNATQFNSVSWGSPSSMVKTRFYNKTMELKEGKHDKAYIKNCWVMHGLIDNPVTMQKKDDKGVLYQPQIWRIEYAMTSAADGWLRVEFNNGKKETKQIIPHNLSLFDTPAKLWDRFRDLSQNYFHFKYREFKGQGKAIVSFAMPNVIPDDDRQLRRKSLCRDKVLFYWNEPSFFYRLQSASVHNEHISYYDVLLNKLQEYKQVHSEKQVVDACDILIKDIMRYKKHVNLPQGDSKEIKALQLALSYKMSGDDREAVQILKSLLLEISNSETELFV